MTLSLLVLSAGCQREEIVSVEQDDVMEVYATIEDIDDAQTRTYLSGTDVYWSSGDKIAVFNGNLQRKLFNVDPENIGSKDATFYEDEKYSPEGSDTRIANNIAYYPFCDVTCAPDGSSYTLGNLTLPETQTYVAGSVGLGSFPMVAVTQNIDDVNFRFKNICGVMQFQLTGYGFVKSVSVKGNNDEILSGPAVVTAGYGKDPSIAMSAEGGKVVTLDCGEGGVELNETTPASFFIVLPPVQFEGGFTITVTDTWGGSKEYSTTKKNPIVRSKGLRMPAKEYVGEKPVEIKDPQDLATQEPANCYIVSKSGSYSFPSVKGNGNESVGSVASAEVLWETFGTDQTPNKGDLIAAVKYENGQILFATPATFQKGNAVIAAKDASGTILWSWHIWLTDEPEEQVYYNNAGTMMDRNLGATSATPGDVGALGLLYQWGRKDPFLGSSEIKSGVVAKSTMIWPECTVSDASTGTIEYTISNPTIFITENKYNSDWWYCESEDMETDNTRWQPEKTIYDPCPSGWRVPDCANSGVWAMATGKDYDLYSSSYNPSYYQYEFDYSDNGVNFSNIFGSSLSIWYPAAGSLSDTDGSLGLYYTGIYWTCPGWTNSPWANPMSMGEYMIRLGTGFGRAGGFSVRCVKEGSQSSGDQSLASSASDLGTDGTANSYIVSKSGTYKFKPVKGNSSTSVGSVSSVEVLWESFGTDVTPNVGDLIKTVNYDAGYVVFTTPSSFTRGNAVIAAKDADGNILWSWHIWLTDQPQGQVYYNNAGTMMDRNLGATSATPGDVGALGLLYQWGRKDPFLGSSSISSNIEAKSTGTWPSAVSSNSTNGTIEYATAYPTTFIEYNSSNYDWYYTGSSTTDNTRWTTSTATKSIYDPCPSGWRVPDGGNNGIWSKALGSSSNFEDALLYDSTNEGMNFSGKFGSASTIWYPASGFRYYGDGSLYYVGDRGYYWSASPFSNFAYYLLFSSNGFVNPSFDYSRALGLSVRCLQE